MALSRQDTIHLVGDQLFPLWQKESDRLHRIDKWYRWEQEQVHVPSRVNAEMKRLVDLVRTPWLGLVVSTVAQCLYVDGYRSADDTYAEPDDISEPWRTWLSNGFDQRQIAVHRGALAYGYSFVTVLPGEDDTGKRSVLRGVSPRKMQAIYDDPAEDDYPRYVLRVDAGADHYRLRVLDDEHVHYLTLDNAGSTPVYERWETHDSGVCPVVRYANMLDLDGRCPGEVEPFIPIAERINKTVFDRLLTQHFSSWKIRTVSGMVQPDNDEETNRQKLKLRQDDILIAEDPDTKFGTLAETPLDGFIAATRNEIESLAAITQTPTHALTGQLVNLSAEALAAARAGLTQKVAERQKAFGRSHVRVLQLAAMQEGRYDEARDLTARVTWQDMEVRSMSQAVDALGKAAEMLQIPADQLWQRIPGVEKSDVDEWKKAAAQADPLTRMADELSRQTPVPVEDTQ